MAADTIAATADGPTTALAGRSRGSAVVVEDFESAEEGLRRQEDLAASIASDRPAPVLVWRSPAALIVSRADTRLPRFDAAVERLAEEGWPVVVRRSGGSACPVSPGTLQVALARTVAQENTIDANYLDLAGRLRRFFLLFGLEAATGEVPEAFCPGRFDMSVGGRKLVGMAQHWRQRDGQQTATTAATLIADEDVAELSRIVDLFYGSADGRRRCSPEALCSMRQQLSASRPAGATTVTALRERLVATLASSDEAQMRP